MKTRTENVNVNRMTSGVLMTTACALLMMVTAAAQATVVSVNETNNIAPTGVLSTPDTDGIDWNAGGAIDTLVSDGVPGQPSFEDAAHAYFVDNFGTNSTNELVLTFASPYNLTELVAYVASGDATGFVDADRNVANVEFFVNTGGGLLSVGSVVPGATDDVGGFERVALAGSWGDATQVMFAFTPTATQGVRVAEVLVIGTEVPAPASGALAAVGLGLIGMRRRTRR